MQLRTAFSVEKMIVSGFLLVILAGAFLLWLSNNYIYGINTQAVDALFMATSAVCVTGLATISVGGDMGFVTQAILLCLIQLGGLGFMTAMLLLGLAIGRRIGIKGRIYFLGGLGVEGLQGAVGLLKMLVCYTFFLEAAGAVILYFGFIRHGETVFTSVYYAIFHSVSAFCNAGFSPYVSGLHDFHLALIVPGTIMLLIVMGGVGFPVFAECWDCAARRRRLPFYPRLVIYMTLSLIVVGAALILLSDWKEGLAGMPAWAKVWNALFASITARTAGFDTVDPADFSGLGRLVTVILMIIGASPASTGGGIKTTTFGVLAIAVWNELRGRRETIFWNRRINDTKIRRSLALAALYVNTFLLGAVVLNVLENLPFSLLLYEAASAMGTVGLTLGVTTKLSAAGKMVVVLLMFWGRVGILSFFAALIPADSKEQIHYTETYIPIG